MSGIKPDPEARACYEQAPNQVRAALGRYRPDLVLITEFSRTLGPILMQRIGLQR